MRHRRRIARLITIGRSPIGRPPIGRSPIGRSRPGAPRAIALAADVSTSARLFTVATGLLALAVVLTLLFAGPVAAQPWTDLGQSTLGYYDLTAADVGDISDGYSDGTWRPYDDMTRAQFVKMAVERFELTLLNPASPTFEDVPPNHQYYRYIETAYRAGMILGVGDGHFAPTRTIDRAQGAAIIVRYLADLRGTTTEDLYSHTQIETILQPYDEGLVTIGTELADEMAAAVDWGIVRGTADNELQPRSLLVRIQGAAMLLRADVSDIQEVQVHVYLSRDGEIVSAHRTVSVGPALEVGSAALQQLFAGPTQAEAQVGVTTEIPDGTQLNGLNIEDGLAMVDLDSDFLAGGDQASERMRLAQIVYTLTDFRTVDRVHFHVAGDPLGSLGGIDLDPFVTRPSGTGDPFEDETPAIFVDSPGILDEIASAVRVQGTANVFEATFQLEIHDANETVLAHEVVTATAGTGTRGIFDVTVPFSQPATATGRLVVYSESAQDGSRINVKEIPVSFGE